VKDWQPSAYSPRTGLLYIPSQNLCMDEEGLSANYISGTPYVGMNVKMHPGPGGNRGVFQAWNPVTGKQVWSIKEDLPVWSGALATAGDVVFYGTMDGWLKAVNARTGDLLWQFKTGSGIIGQRSATSAPTASSTSPCCRHRRVGRRDRRRRARRARFVGGVGVRKRHARLADKTALGGTLYIFGL